VGKPDSDGFGQSTSFGWGSNGNGEFVSSVTGNIGNDEAWKAEAPE